MRLSYLVPLLFSCVCKAATNGPPSTPPDRKPALTGAELKGPAKAGITKSTSTPATKPKAKILPDASFDLELAIYQKDTHGVLSLLYQRTYDPVTYLELAQLVPNTLQALNCEKISTSLKKEVILAMATYLVQATTDGAFNIVGKCFIGGLDAIGKRSFADVLVKRYRQLYHFDTPFSYSSLPWIASPYYRAHSSRHPYTLFGPLILVADLREKILLMLWAFDFLVAFEERGDVAESQISYIRLFTDEMRPAAKFIGKLCGIVIGLFRPVNGIFADTTIMNRLERNLKEYFDIEIGMAPEDSLSTKYDPPVIYGALECLYAMRFYDHDMVLQVMDHWAARAPAGPYSIVKTQLQKVYNCFHNGTPLTYEDSSLSERLAYMSLFLASNRRNYHDDQSISQQPYSPIQIILENDLSDATVRFYTATFVAFDLKILKQNIICLYAALQNAFEENNVSLATRIEKALTNRFLSTILMGAQRFLNTEVFTKKLPEWLAHHK